MTIKIITDSVCDILEADRQKNKNKQGEIC